ncbi:MAG: branched-chain amino acid ABC transporter permease [Candidatus Bathyarchaeia archaeon]
MRGRLKISEANLKFNKTILTVTFLVLALIFVPLVLPTFFIIAMTLIFFYIICAEAWSFMAAHAGMISLGQQVFIGLGSYSVVIFNMLIGWPLWVSILLAINISSAIAAALSIPLLRLKGIYFAIGTWLTSEIFRLSFNNWGYVNAATGLLYRPAYEIPVLHVYYSALILCLATIYIFFTVYRSRIGLGLRAIASNEMAACIIGVKPLTLKMFIFVISACITASAGALYVHFHPYISPASCFALSWTVNLMFISVIGGYNRIFGPVIGSLFFVALEYILAEYPGLTLILEGIICILILKFLGYGLWTTLAEKLKIKPPL